MKNQFIVLLTSLLTSYLFTITNSVADDWKYVGISGLSYGEYNLYVDIGKLEKHNDLVVMYELHSFKFEQFAPQGGYKSQTQKWEYDCKNMMLRALDKILYSEHMGKGSIISKREAKTIDWIKVNPGEALEAKWRVACALAKG